MALKWRKEDLIRIGKRENNRKRSYLVVNPLQGKHIPADPVRALELFGELAELLKRAYAQEKLLLVGFAETATAIGAAAAVRSGSMYIQTTREDIPGVEFLLFSEDHSHATEQRLVKDDIDRIIRQIDRIIFVEDEVTTGKTILHIIEVLQAAYPRSMRFAVASILNGMDAEALGIYKEKNIPLHYLVKMDTGQESYTRAAETALEDGVCVPVDTGADRTDAEEIRIGGWLNARRLVDAGMYQKACEELSARVFGQTGLARFRSLLVLGTEEFMYPALYVAARARAAGLDVACHSTTRSPVAVSCRKSYPLHTRYELRSLYDGKRVTYLYDIGRYEAVLILTDAQGGESEGVSSLVHAVRTQNEGPVFLVRWCTG